MQDQKCKARKVEMPHQTDSWSVGIILSMYKTNEIKLKHDNLGKIFTSTIICIVNIFRR